MRGLSPLIFESISLSITKNQLEAKGGAHAYLVNHNTCIIHTFISTMSPQLYPSVNTSESSQSAFVFAKFLVQQGHIQILAGI